MVINEAFTDFLHHRSRDIILVIILNEKQNSFLLIVKFILDKATSIEMLKQIKLTSLIK